MDGIIACVDMAECENQTIDRPIVALGRNWGEHIPIIHSDHEKGGILAAEAMYRAGCRKILHFWSGGKGAPFEERHRVFREYLESRGVEVIDVEAVWNQMSYRYNQETAQTYMEQYPDVDGIFATDVLALGCMAAAARMGRRIPEELQILAYDGTEITGLAWPALTCIRQNLAGLAKAAVSTMIQILEGRPAAEKMVIPVEFRPGGTLRR